MRQKLVPKGTKICPSCPNIKPQSNNFNFGKPVMKKPEQTSQVISIINQPKKKKGIRGLF